jgi:hypothetical protein
LFLTLTFLSMLVNITHSSLGGLVRWAMRFPFWTNTLVRINGIHHALWSKNRRLVKTLSGTTSGLKICHHHRCPKNMDPQSKLRPTVPSTTNPFFRIFGNAEDHPCGLETTLPPTPLPRAMISSLVSEDARKPRMH